MLYCFVLLFKVHLLIQDVVVKLPCQNLSFKDIQEGGAALTRSSTRQRLDGLTAPRFDQEGPTYTSAFFDVPSTSILGVNEAEGVSTEPRVVEANVVPGVNDGIHDDDAAIPGPSGLNRKIEADIPSQSQSMCQFFVFYFILVSIQVGHSFDIMQSLGYYEIKNYNTVPIP